MATEFNGIVNRAQTNISSAVTSTASIFTVVDATVFPSSGQFYASVAGEIVLCTSLNGNDMIVTRGQDSTTAAAHGRFVSIEQKVVAAMFTDIHGAVNSLEVYPSKVDSLEDQVGSFFVSSLNDLVNSVFCSSLWDFVGSTFCGSHTVETQSIHGVEGDILGTTDVQSVVNKWLYDCQFRYAAETITGSSEITNSSHLIFVNPSTLITINLTESTAATAGRPLEIKQVVSANTITLQPYDAQHIDAASDYVLSAANAYVVLRDCGSGWNILGSS